MLPPVAQSNSCCAQVKACLCHPDLAWTGKGLFWFSGVVGSLFIPIPGLNAALAGANMFMMAYSLTARMCTTAAASRTWKDLTAGATISAGGAALWQAAAPSAPGPAILCLVGGVAAGLRTTYSTLCGNEYELVLPEASEEAPPAVQPSE